MNTKEISKLLDGCQYGVEHDRIEDGLFKQLKKDGFVIVIPYSDDGIHFCGAIIDEVGAFNGAKIKVYKTGNLIPHDEEEGYFRVADGLEVLGLERSSNEAVNIIDAIWCPKDKNCSWDLKSDIPHETFNIFEDKELFGVGLVFNVTDLK